tara:strand:+ start:1321 stop:2049 length:729 start_codon:yes stop_codon:yes gene_type:complete
MKLNDMSKQELITLGKQFDARVNGRMKPMTLIEEIGKVCSVERTFRGESVSMEQMSKDDLLEVGLILDLMIDARMSETTIINLIIAESPESVDYVLLVDDKAILDDDEAPMEAPTEFLIDKLDELESELVEAPVEAPKTELPTPTVDNVELPKSKVDIRKHMYGIDGKSKRKIIQFEKITCAYLYKYGIQDAYSEAVQLNAAPLIQQNLLALQEFWVQNGYLVVRNTWNSWMLRFDKRGFRE